MSQQYVAAYMRYLDVLSSNPGLVSRVSDVPTFARWVGADAKFDGSFFVSQVCERLGLEALVSEPDGALRVDGGAGSSGAGEAEVVVPDQSGVVDQSSGGDAVGDSSGEEKSAALAGLVGGSFRGKNWRSNQRKARKRRERAAEQRSLCGSVGAGVEAASVGDCGIGAVGSGSVPVVRELDRAALRRQRFETVSALKSTLEGCVSSSLSGAERCSFVEVDAGGAAPQNQHQGYNRGGRGGYNRDVLRRRKRNSRVVGGGACSSCPSYGQALSDAENEARQSLARRRAVENEVAEQLARMKLASLRDEKKCKDYADLKRQRLIQWQNEALAKSQASLDKCKTIDPGSSSSQADIRAQAKELEDLKYSYGSLVGMVYRVVPDKADDMIAAVKPPGTATMEFDMAQAETYAGMAPGSVDAPSDDFELMKARARMGEQVCTW